MIRRTQGILRAHRSNDASPRLKDRRRRLAFLVALVASLEAIPALATDRFVNPEFDSNVDGWFANTASGVPGWDVEDRYGCEGSGSAILTGRLPLPYTAQIAQCIPVFAGETLSVEFGAKPVFAPSAVQGHVRVELSVATCDVTSWSHSSATSAAPVATWTRISDEVPIPPGYLTAWVIFELWSPAEFDVLFDVAYGSDLRRVFTDGFEYGSTCRW